MAGFVQTFEWDDHRFQEKIRTAIAHTKDMSEPMYEFSEYMMSETMERFEHEQDPQGRPWQVLSPVTQALRAAEGKSGKILQVDGILRNAIQGYSGRNSGGLLVDGSNAEYATIHNLGGMAGRSLKVEIPQREYAGFNDDDVEEALHIISDWLVM